MTLNPNIDREFYETFAQKCRAREGIVRRAAADRVSGELTDGAARQSVASEVHDLAGEAAMLGLGLVAAPASRIAHAARADRDLPPDFWDLLGDWSHRLGVAARELADGDDPTAALAQLDKDVAAKLA